VIISSVGTEAYEGLKTRKKLTEFRILPMLVSVIYITVSFVFRTHQCVAANLVLNFDAVRNLDR
jgi:hypothetical protein